MGSGQCMYMDGRTFWTWLIGPQSLVHKQNILGALQGLHTYANDTREGEKGRNQCMLVQEGLFAMVVSHTGFTMYI
jgi:hypothetical protein